MAKREPVDFTVGVFAGRDYNKVAEDLKKNYPKVTVDKILMNGMRGAVILCSADKRTYEQAFNAKLEWRGTPRQKLNPPRVVTMHQWVETKKAEIPESLQGMVRYIELSVKRTTCD